MRMLDDKICFLKASGINHEFKRKVASSAIIEDDIENCFIIKPFENEELKGKNKITIPTDLREHRTYFKLTLATISLIFVLIVIAFQSPFLQ